MTMVYESALKSDSFSKTSGKDAPQYLGSVPDIILLSKSNEDSKENKDVQKLSGRTLNFNPANTLRGPVFSKKPKVSLRKNTVIKGNTLVDNFNHAIERQGGTSLPKLSPRNGDGGLETGDSGINDERTDCEHSDVSDHHLMPYTGPKSISRPTSNSETTKLGLLPPNKSRHPRHPGLLQARQQKLLAKRGSYQSNTGRPGTDAKDNLQRVPSVRIAKLSYNANTNAGQELADPRPITFSFASSQRRTIGSTLPKNVGDFPMLGPDYNTHFLLTHGENEAIDFVAEEAIRKSIRKCKAWILRYWDYL